MQNSKLVFRSLLHALGVLVYVVLVVIVMNNAQRIFGNLPHPFWIPVAMILLFVVSATIASLLVLGRPAYLYLNGQKSEGLRLLFYTVAWLVIITVLVFLGLAFRF